MKKQIKRTLSLLLALALLPLWNIVPAQAAEDGKSVMGVQVGGLVSYGIDRSRIYQGGKYDATIKIGENLSFTGTLSEGLSDEMLQKCIDDALAAEHLTKKDIIETNKMVAELTAKMKNPQDFWAELDFYSEMLGWKQYTDTIKHMVGSATKPGEGVYKSLTAQEKQFVQEQLGKTMGESFDAWKAGLTGQAADKAMDKLNPDSFLGTAVGTAKIADKAYKVLSGVWKAMQRNIEQEKSLDALKESAMKRKLLVEAFYKRAGTLVKNYLKDYGQWEIRIDGSRQKGAKVEQMTKLNFDVNDTGGNFSTFYAIQPIKLTWRADAYFLKDDHSENPNGTYTGRIQVTGEYDTATLKEHIIPMIKSLYGPEIYYDSYGTSIKPQTFERSKPSVKQTWRVDQCQIEILGLSENGAASIQLPNLVEEKSISMDYEVSCGFTMQGHAYITKHELCTPEHATVPVEKLPDIYRGEVMNWVAINKAVSTNIVADYEPDDGIWGDQFIIRAPFEGFTGYKRLEITKPK